MMITYCKECNKSVLMPNPIPEGNQDPDGFIVCKKCYWLNYSPEKMKGDKRDKIKNGSKGEKTKKDSLCCKMMKRIFLAFRYYLLLG